MIRNFFEFVKRVSKVLFYSDSGILWYISRTEEIEITEMEQIPRVVVRIPVTISEGLTRWTRK